MSQKTSFFDKIGLDRLSGRVGEFLDEVFLPEEIAETLRRASEAMEREEYDAALTLLFRAHAEQPSFQRTHHLIGQCYFHQGAYKKALAAFERALAGREDASSHLWAGLAAEELARQTPKSRYFHQAQVHLRRALESSGASALEFELYFALGRVYLGQGRADKAIRELKKATKRRPEQLEAHLALARALLKRGRLEQAHELLEQPPLQDAGAEAWSLRGEVEEARGNTRAALKAYQQAIDARGALELLPASTADADENNEPDAQPKSAAKPPEDNSQLEQSELNKALLGAARASLKLGDMARANPYLLRAQQHAEGAQLAEVMALLGQANEAVGNEQRALEYYQSALAIPHLSASVQARATLGAGRLSLKKPASEENLETARAYFQTLLNGISQLSGAQRRAAQLGLAEVFLASGELSDARRLVDEVLRRTSTPIPAALHLLGRIALKSGDPAEAAVAFEEAHSALKTALQKSSAASDNLSDLSAAEVDQDLSRALEAMRFSWQLPAEITGPSELLDLLHQTQDFVGSDGRLAAFMPRAQQLVSELDQPLSIALVGEFNAGKSTLLNAIIGEEVAPVGILPTTAHTCFVRYGPRKSAQIVYRDGRKKEVSLDEAKQQMKTDAAEVDHLQVFYPHPDLRLVEFWDTPGFNALEDAHEETATRALQEAEGILWVLDANQALSQTEFSQIEKVNAGEERLVVLLNKIDRLGEKGAREDAVGELINYIREHTGAQIAGCFALAAKEALNARLAPEDESSEQHQESLEESGFLSFRQFLDSALIERSGRIKTIEISRKTAILLQDLAHFQQNLLQNYRQVAQESEKIDQWLKTVREDHPQKRARQEARRLEDRFDFMLSALDREVDEALSAQATLLSRAALTRPSLTPEDRAFILELLSERIDDILGRSLTEILNDIEEIESKLAQKIGALIGALPPGDRRAMSRRLEGFFDETRVLKMLLSERVYGRLQALSVGQINAAGHSALDSLSSAQTGGARGALRPLVPDVRTHLGRELVGWYKEFFLAARRFLDRVQRDLHLLDLEGGHRFDVSAPRALIHL